MLDVTNTTKQKFTPNFDILRNIKDHILGKEYDLSVVIISDKKSRSLNKKFRNKDYPTNVLSFPLSDDAGEIFLNLKKSVFEAKDFEMKTRDFLYYLLIHSMLHLKGYDHGKEMEKEEKKFMKKFSIKN